MGINKRPSNASLQGLFVESGKPAKRQDRVVGSPGPNKAIVRVNGQIEYVDRKGVNVSAFTGKAGKLRRSGEGNITRALNGSREYQEEWWNEDGFKVIAY